MLKRNDFPLEVTVFYLFGILFFNPSTKALSISSSGFGSEKCCSDSTPLLNSTVFNGTNDIVNYIQPFLEKPEPLYDSENPNQNIIPLSRNITNDEVSFSENNNVVNSGLISDSFSNWSNGSNLEYSNQNVTANDTNLYQYIDSYSILDFDSSNNSEHSTEGLLSEDNSPSAFISTSYSHNVSIELQNSNSTAKNEDLEGNSTTIVDSPEIVELNESSKEDNSGEYSSFQSQFTKNHTNSSITKSSHHDFSKYILEIFLLNSSEQAEASYASEEQTYGLKNYYQLATNNFDNDSIEITESNNYEETTEHEEKGKESSALNISSIQFNLLSPNVSSLTIQNWFYSLSVDKPSKNESVSNNAVGIEPLKNQFEYKTDLETSSEVSVNESSLFNHSLATLLPTITSKTQVSFLNRTTVEDLSIIRESTTEFGQKFSNLSLGTDLNTSTNGTILVTSSQGNITDISSTNCSINDSKNDEFGQSKRISSQLQISKGASYTSNRSPFPEHKEDSNGDMTYPTPDMSITTSTYGYVTLMNVTTNISDDRLMTNILDHTISTDSKVNETGNLALASEMNNTTVNNIQIAIVKPISSASMPTMVHQFPSVLLATEYNHPVSNHFTYSKKQHSSIILSSNGTSLDNKHTDSSLPQTFENKKKTSLSSNDLQLITNNPSNIGDSLISITNDVLVKSSRNDKTLFQNFTDLSNNTVWSTEQYESYNQQSKDLFYNQENKSRDYDVTEKNLFNTTSSPLLENRDGGKIFWKPLTNFLFSSSQPPPVEEAITERKLIWNLCFTKKPGPFRNSKEMLMTKGPGNTKVFWNLCPTKKPYLTTSSYHPTESSLYTSTSTISSPLSLIDISSSPSGSGSLTNEFPTEVAPLEEDGTTQAADTTEVTYTETPPEETTQSLEEQKEYLFPVYWNVPTFQCHKYGLNFSRVKDWGLLQNYQDEFRGEEIAILYDPGEFPALLPASGGRRVQRNGGVPQEGSLTRHLSLFQSHLEKLIPNVDFNGLAIIDFEHWRPVWRQNWGSLSPYRDFSRLIEKRRHPFWFSAMVEVEATYRYELGARVFLLDTLRLGKKLRPKAKWGYYGFPFCFNYTPHNNRASCSYEVQLDNDNMYWLFTETTAYYPSLYLKYNDMYSTKRQRFIKGRLDEALRVANGVPVYPYIWFKYHDSRQFLTKEDMVNLLKIPKDYSCKGAVIWGASRDVNSREKCLALQSYLEEVIGPAVKDLQEENFRGGSVDHEVEENSEEEFDEEEDEKMKEKKISYDIREFEV